MAVDIVICLNGPGKTGKSAIIREFTAAHFLHPRAGGDVLGIFAMPWRNYAVGVNGSGDNLNVVRDGLAFLNRYNRLRVMIVASRSRGVTIEAVRRFATDENADFISVETEDRRDWRAAIGEKVSEILSHMPGRDERDA